MTAAERERFMLEFSRDEERAVQGERLRIRRAQREALRELRTYKMLIPGPEMAIFEKYADAIESATRAPRGKRRKS